MGRNNRKPTVAKKDETKMETIKRLRDEILKEAKSIANGLTESCYSLVEKSKKLQVLDPDDEYEDLTEDPDASENDE